MLSQLRRKEGQDLQVSEAQSQRDRLLHRQCRLSVSLLQRGRDSRHGVLKMDISILENTSDVISRQAAIDALDVLCQEHRYRIPGKRETYSQYNEAWQDALDRAQGAINNLQPVQPTQTNCEYCHTDRDGYVFPLEKNSHAFIDRDKIVLKAKGWRGEAKIKYCPICGRRLADG